MNLGHLILREILHRMVNTLLALLGVSAAAACLTAGLALLRGHDVQTDEILTQAAAKTKARTEELTNDYRRIALELGFNVFILPAESAATGAPSIVPVEMDYDHVKKLANASIITIEHLLPSLSVPLFWPEQKLAITLTGIHGEVPIAGKGKKPKEPLIQPVLPGQVVLGYEVAKKTGLKTGENVMLLGEAFTVSGSHPARGTNDDHTLWIDLATSQRLLNKEGRITAIQAINCLAPNCHPDATGIPSVTAEIAKVLPDVRVVIDMSKAKTRIDARVRAMEEAKAALAAQADQRAEIRSQIERLASILVPVVIAGCSIWIAMLALSNARERQGEVGILRALGVSTGSILALFLGRSLLIGLLGAGLGLLAGWAVSIGLTRLSPAQLIDPAVVAIALLGAPLLTTLASWLPAMSAAQQDPAAVLGKE